MTPRRLCSPFPSGHRSRTPLRWISPISAAPSSTPMILSRLFRRKSPAQPEPPPPFIDWLMKQDNRGDDVGGLARYVAGDGPLILAAIQGRSALVKFAGY